MPAMQPVSAQDQIQQFTNQLHAHLLRKEELSAALRETDTQITALRNILGGVDLGKQQAAEAAKQKEGE